MKLSINKAYDLNSISVLPPHSRRPAMSQASQSFSQGMSMSQSQLSQSEFDENLINDQRFDSQERDKSSKRISSMTSGVAARDESQLQLVRVSNSAVRRWGSAPENRCHISEELENRFRQMESSLSRLGMILDSVQSDIIQVNRAVKETSLGTEGVRQKILLLDNSMGLVIKEEEGLKAFLDAKLKSISQQILDSDQNRLNEITSRVSHVSETIRSQLAKFHYEICAVVAEKIEVTANRIKCLNNSYRDPHQSPKSNCHNTLRSSQKTQIPIPMPPPVSYTRRAPASKIDVDIPKSLKPKVTGSKRNTNIKQEEIPLPQQGNDFGVSIDSDEESDGGLSCLLVKKETGKASYLIEEAKEESLRIIRRARIRKRKQNSCVILD